MRLALLIFIILAGLPAMALVHCPAEYSEEQCDQMADEDGTTGGSGTTGGGACPYQMCGNAVADFINSYDWCEATNKQSNCPISYCAYQACIGTNCTPTSGVCSTCSSRSGNTADIEDCPR
jgi:hypothetical protein